MTASWKSRFSRFIGAQPDRLLFAAHSHHPWPDVTFEAQQQAWLDAARYADTKWDRVFGELIPRAQAHVARLLRLPDAATICFAPSTHELVVRLLSALPANPRVLTTDSEFHSFARQMKRLEEANAARVDRVPVAPYETFAARFKAAAARGGHDLVCFSHCFYNTGFLVEDPVALVEAVADPQTCVLVDGYHSFMAVPIDFSRVAHRAFYTAGGYKYAMTGEGACFLHCPPGVAERPVNTGWFASFGTLTAAQAGAVPYAQGGQRFMGGTFDPAPLYRFNAVQQWLLEDGITVEAIRAHVLRLQARFLELRDRDGLLPDAELVPPAGTPRGNFFVLRHARARAWHGALLAAGVMTDCRDDRLRIGFGLHQDEGDVDALALRLLPL
ncbi:MAG TPA: aminotransferase class V-fold PLP-dependent enzyme [Verrucomicrobiae bacterium]|nr:aminotransferase class V-fold PLP-dependent enzyme [Verrucomicrobiae bacterium]